MRHLHCLISASLILASTLWLVPVQGQDYAFERMWPALQQPWYFVTTRGIAVDSNDTVVVVDSFKHRIHRFSSNGRITSLFGQEGVHPGELMFPISAAVDRAGNIYVAETDTGEFRRIQKFSPDGEPLLQFGEFGGGPGQFGIGSPEDNGFSPFDIELDQQENIWVSGSNRLQQFDPQGNFLSAIPAFDGSPAPFEFVTGFDFNADGNIVALDGGTGEVLILNIHGEVLSRFGSGGQGPGQIAIGNDVEVDDRGRIYVADAGNAKVLRFSPDGQQFIEWGSFGSGPGQFQTLWRLDFDSDGRVYTVDASDDDFGSHRVQKFTDEGRFLQQWGAAGTEDGQFIAPDGISVGPDGSVFVTDPGNNRVQAFSSNGRFQRSLGAGVLDFPTKVVAASDGTLYVVETFSGRVQRLSATGEVLATSTAALEFPGPIAIADSGDVYVGDILGHRVYRLNANLNVIDSWGGRTQCFETNTGASLPCNDGEFNEPRSLTIDRSSGTPQLLVGDYFNLRIQRFDLEGNFIEKFSTEFFPTAIRAEESGNILLLPFSDSRTNTGHFFARLSPEGELLGTWSDFGSNPGQLTSPTDLDIAPDGTVYVADAINHRVVAFREVDSDRVAKAVVVAGGGPFPGNALWEATQLNATFAYRTLLQQGYTKDTIQYLSADTTLDLDGNGIADDVDDVATVETLETALTQWATDADDVVVYLVDHGGSETFRMTGTQLLSASQLGSFVDTLQNAALAPITIIYDACQSGSFLDALTNPQRDRVVIASAQADQSAFFVDGGSLSFSNHFWSQIFAGGSVADAFDTARTITEAGFPEQSPLIDANGDGQSTTTDVALAGQRFIGNATANDNTIPSISTVTDPSTLASGNTASFFADGVADDDGVARVWGVVRPPSPQLPGTASDPVRSLPEFELAYVNDGRSRWEGQYSGFDTPGTYTITLNAEDSNGNRAIPRITSLTVESPLSRRAIVFDSLRTTSAKGAGENPAAAALAAQDYSEDEVTELSNSPSATATPSVGNLQSALQNALSQTGTTQDMLLTIAANKGEGQTLTAGGGTIAVSDIDSALDDLQDAIAGTITVVLEGDQTGALVPALAPDPGQDRIVIASAGAEQDTLFEFGGDISFGQVFWGQVELGATLSQAFAAGEAFLQTSTSPQIPQFEDNGNGVANDGTDGRRTQNFTLGSGVVVAGDPPLIGDIAGPGQLNGNASATVTVSDITTTGEIARVTAMITPPGSLGNVSAIGSKPVIRSLVPSGTNRFDLNFEDFSVSGEYQIAIWASDTENRLSPPARTKVTQLSGSSVPGFAVNPGISGAWLDPDHNGEGWLIQILDDQTALVYWFTYGPRGEDASRQLWVGAQTGRIEGPNIIIEQMITTSGPRFGDAFDADALRLNPWGDVVFRFDDCNSGQMYYRGRDGFGQGRQNLARLTSLANTSCDGDPTPVSNSEVSGRNSGAWFNADRAGEGWLLEILPDNQALTVWFTYDQLGRQQWLIGLGTVTENRVVFDEMLRPDGAFFGPLFRPEDVVRERWGTLEFVFSDCGSGTINYSADDDTIGSGSQAVTALTKISGLECE